MPRSMQGRVPRQPPLAWAIALVMGLAPHVAADPIDPAPALGADSERAAEPLPDSPQLKQAAQWYRRGDLDQTLTWLRKATAADPALSPPELLLGNMLFSEERVGQAVDYFERAARQYPSDPEPHLIFGDLALRRRRICDAEVQYSRAETLASTLDESNARRAGMVERAAMGLAQVAEARHDLTGAITRYRSLLEQHPDLARAHFRLGNVLYAHGDQEGALAELRLASQLLTNAPSPLLTLAQLAQQAGKLDEADNWMQRAVDESSDDASILLAMARWQLEMRQAPQKAATWLEKARLQSPESIEVDYLSALVAWAQGELSRAEETLESVVLQQPDHLAASNALAAVLAEQNDPKRLRRAQELIQLTASTNQRSTETLAVLGWVAFKAGNLELADRNLRPILQDPSASRDSRYYLSRTLFQRGQIDAALRLLRDTVASTGPFIHMREARRWMQDLVKPEKSN
ncbi:MAG: tetratricopeptide repeat protein [Planctomycetales bacterium]|nr:tetratricopeptide repeat protein [Planctomycetales bacterium]